MLHISYVFDQQLPLLKGSVLRDKKPQKAEQHTVRRLWADDFHAKASTQQTGEQRRLHRVANPPTFLTYFLPSLCSLISFTRGISGGQGGSGFQALQEHTKSTS
eukprot:4614238-Amphidinium_carterae.1